MGMSSTELGEVQKITNMNGYYSAEKNCLQLLCIFMKIPLITHIELNLHHVIPVPISIKYNSREADEQSEKDRKRRKKTIHNIHIRPI